MNQVVILVQSVADGPEDPLRLTTYLFMAAGLQGGLWTGFAWWPDHQNVPSLLLPARSMTRPCIWREACDERETWTDAGTGLYAIVAGAS